MFMNILCVSHYFPPHLGGLELVALSQSTRLVNAGHSVTVVTSKVRSDENNEAQNGVRIIRVHAANFLEKYGVPFPFFFPQIVGALKREIRNADVVHLHDCQYLSSFMAALIAKRLRKPIVLMQHVAMVTHPSRIVMAAQNLIFRTIGVYVTKASAKIITLNDRVADFMRSLGASEAALVALANGVDSVTFHPVDFETKLALRRSFGIATDKKIILFVGRFVPKKGFDVLLQARSERYQIVFCGGDAPKEARNEPDVHFLGEVRHGEMHKVYQCADMFVLPSTDEGFPLSIQEAMATGLPVITTDDPGYRRYRLDAQRFTLLTQPNPDLIRCTITMLLEDETKLTEMSIYSCQYAAAQFSWEQITQKLIATYRAAIGAAK